MRKKIIFSIIVLSILYVARLSLAEEVFYVQSLRAKIFSQPSFDSVVIIEVQKGYKFNSIEKKGNWIRLSISGKDGYISSYLVGKKAPLSRSEIGQEAATIAETARSRASQQTTAVAGIRGLAEERRARLGKEEKLNYEALEKIEKFSIADEELKVFMKEGNL